MIKRITCLILIFYIFVNFTYGNNIRVSTCDYRCRDILIELYILQQRRLYREKRYKKRKTIKLSCSKRRKNEK